MASKPIIDRFTSADYLPIGTDFVQVRLLTNIDLPIVGVDLRIYHLGKRDDKVELPAPNAMQLVSKNLAAFCSN